MNPFRYGCVVEGEAIRRHVADELIFEYAGEYRFENPFF